MDLVEKQYKCGWKTVEKQQHMQYTEKKQTKGTFMEGKDKKYKLHRIIYLTAGIAVLAASFDAAASQTSKKLKEAGQKIDQLERQKEEAKKKAAAKEQEKRQKEKEKQKEQETEAVSGIIAPENDNFMDEPEVVAQTQAPAEPELHFDAAADLSWPLQGNVVLNYSMDQTVYFATLDQYKYNPAVIIQAEVNTPVKAVAAGKVTSVETSAETGTTLTVDMGDGYSAIYGQLKETPKSQGDYIESGETLGYVSEPTKYYSVEGANLYFELQKDGAPVNPMEYLQ